MKRASPRFPSAFSPLDINVLLCTLAGVLWYLQSLFYVMGADYDGALQNRRPVGVDGPHHHSNGGMHTRIERFVIGFVELVDGPSGMLAEEPRRFFCRVVRGAQPVPVGSSYANSLQRQPWLERSKTVLYGS